METRASYLLVGVFTLFLMGCLFAFTVWLAKSGFEEAGSSRYQILFTGSVAGLQEGSPVRYRGIALGTVRDIRLDPRNIGRVRVTIEVAANTPIKEDAVAYLALEGLSGAVYVEISGGTQESPLLKAEDGELPIIQSRPSSLAALVETTPELLNRLVGLSGQLTGFLTAQNQAEVSRILVNVRTMTDHLARAAAGAEGTVTELGTTLGMVNGLVLDLRDHAGRLTDGVDATLGQTRTTLGSVGRDAGRVTADVSRVTGELRTLAASLNRATLEAEALVKENREPIADFTGTGLYEFTLLIAELRGLVNNLGRVTTRLERDPGDFLFGGTRQGVSVE
ncbi:MlaD family protein [Skermanella pratensis]|uniref:MlaD family protein n=1 Tax=Skermanella pratensis TaxID=2233999 RepID=UPI0013015AD0|nr:MlaD family protein [Skermanella pratensis]